MSSSPISYSFPGGIWSGSRVSSCGASGTTLLLFKEQNVSHHIPRGREKSIQKDHSIRNGSFEPISILKGHIPPTRPKYFSSPIRYPGSQRSRYTLSAKLSKCWVSFGYFPIVECRPNLVCLSNPLIQTIWIFFMSKGDVLQRGAGGRLLKSGIFSPRNCDREYS